MLYRDLGQLNQRGALHVIRVWGLEGLGEQQCSPDREDNWADYNSQMGILVALAGPIRHLSSG